MAGNGMFWLAGLALLAVVLVALVVPLMRRPRKALARAEYDLAIYKDQMRELEDDIAAGLISGSEAEAARNDIARRILAAAEARDKARQELDKSESTRDRIIGLVAGLLLVPAVAISLYLFKGSPGRPDMPIASRQQQQQQQAAHGNDIAALVKRVEERLKEKPDDLEGWQALAPVYARMGRYTKAALAYRNIIRLSGKADADLWNSYGEALTYAARGKVGEQARAAFRKALKLAPGNPMSRYFLAQAALQDGDRQKALAELKGLLKDLPPNFAGRPLIERQVADLEGKGKEGEGKEGKGAEGQKPAASTSASSSSSSSSTAAGPSAAGGPTAEQVRERMKRMKDVPPEARQQMIRNMVEGLEEKLAENPSDLNGWLRLVKAWKVLGETGRARAALEKAKAAMSDNPAAVKALEKMARNLK